MIAISYYTCQQKVVKSCTQGRDEKYAAAIQFGGGLSVADNVRAILW